MEEEGISFLVYRITNFIYGVVLLIGIGSQPVRLLKILVRSERQMPGERMLAEGKDLKHNR